MFKPVPSSVDFVEQEHQILDFWRGSKAFEKLVELRKDGPRWSFIDGPITANNPMGVHHGWGRTYKDLYHRFWAMKGYQTRYQNGFDCQGLWVEVEVERELGFTSKRDIERYGLAKFVDKCKERVRKYAWQQTKQSIRLGYWMDWENSYYTMSDDNNYMVWAFLKKCHERGLIYQGRDTMPWCPRCGTGMSQQEMHEGYAEVTEDSIVVRMPLCGRETEYLLVWTTTPWTLAANVACAVNPGLTYVKVAQNGQVYYLAKSRLEELKQRGPHEVLEQLQGAAMEGWRYRGPFDELPAAAPAVEAHRLVLWELVSGDEGTGIVHVAPGCGKEDFALGQKLGLPVVAPIDEFGVYLEGHGELTGRSAREVDEKVLESLRRKGFYYKQEPYTHSYPHCWRCTEPLLFRNVEEWYIDMSWRGEIKKVAEQVRWIPEWGLERELDWLNNMQDWMISKKRYWGLALPIYQCGCGWFNVIGSEVELEERAVDGWESFKGHTPHRPWIDSVRIRCDKCGKPVGRIPDVGNPWLDAGIIPYSTLNYRQDREYWAQWVPADFATECFPGQFRNWFYSLLAMSTMMENIPPFKTLLGHALVRDSEGREMHKSAGNALVFDKAAERMGCDVMRWVFCRQRPANDLNFGWALGDQTRRKVFDTLWNTYAFFCNYARLDGFELTTGAVPYGDWPDFDRWLLSELHMLVRSANERMEDFDVASLVERAEGFISALSNWYVRRNRRRFWRAKREDDRDKLAAYQTLHEALVTLCKVLAPVIPFLTETMYQNLVTDQDNDAPVSVHLCDYPEANDALIDELLAKQMEVVMQCVSAALGLRESRQLRVRQPLRELIAVSTNPEATEALRRFEAQILEELNVKRLQLSHGSRGVAVEVESVKSLIKPEEIGLPHGLPTNFAAAKAGNVTLILDTRVTPELRAEGRARDTVRHVQQIRKKLALKVEDRIHLRYETESRELARAIKEWRKYIMVETLAVTMEQGVHEADWQEVRIGETKLLISVNKAG